MAVAYTWTVDQREHDVDTGLITTVHWRATATEGEHFVSVYGAYGFQPDPDAPSFVPHANMTEAEVLDRVWSSGVDKEEVERSLAAQMEVQKRTKSLSKLASVILQPVAKEPMLTAEQWVYFLEQTQWTAVIKQATDMMPPGPVRSAIIAAQATTTAFRLPVLLKVVGRVRAMGLGIDLPSDEQITAAFEEAAQFEGLGALLE